MAQCQVDTNTIMYIEPNMETGSAPNLEDFCIMVNLLVRVPTPPLNKSKDISGSGAETVITMSYVANTNSSFVSFSEGTHLTVKNGGASGVSGGTYLTTAPYDYGSWSDLDKKPTSECFGIDSIDIEYNNYMIPIVTIKFTDIRGISLFQPAEINYSSDDETKQTVEESFFKCFFTFPYPQFTLQVKGFYGEPATYHLTVQDFRSAFDSNTGNFTATVKFIGYQGALLTDIMANAITIAPYTENGRTMWEESIKQEDGYQIVGLNGGKIPMMTLVDFIAKIGQLENSVNKIDPNSEVGKKKNDVENKIIELKNIDDAFRGYISTINQHLKDKNFSTFIDLTSYLASYYYTEDDNFKDPFKIIEEDDKETIKPKYNTLEELLNKYSENETANRKLIENFRSAVTPLEENTDGYKTYGGTEDETLSQNIRIRIPKNTTYSGVYVYHFERFAKELNDEMTKLTNEQNEIDKEVEKITQEKFESELGFKPSVQNITEMFLAHLDLILKLILQTRKAVIDSNRDGTTLGMSSGYIGPFPDITQITRRQEGDVKEDKWIGEANPSAPEAILVEEILNAVKKAAPIITSAKGAVNGDINEQRKLEEHNKENSGEEAQPINTFVTALDYKLNGEHGQQFKQVENLSVEDLYSAISQREVNVRACCIDDATKNNIVSYATEDAGIFKNIFNDTLPQDTLAAILNNALSFDDYVDVIDDCNDTFTDDDHSWGQKMYWDEDDYLPYGVTGGCDSSNKIVTTVSDGKRYYGEGDDKLELVEKIFLDDATYFNAFVAQLRVLYTQKNNDANKTITEQQEAAQNIKTTVDMKLATYKYLKLINDRWISFDGAYEEAWKFQVFKKRWVYMDSFYNKNGQELIVNAKHLVDVLYSAQNSNDMSVLSVLSSIYQHTHCSLHTIHNFLDTTNDKGFQDATKMSNIFVPIPYANMNTLMSATPYIVVLYSSEYSKYLEGSPQDDGFNVCENDTLSPTIPLAITSRANTIGTYKIPCFGVNYGRQYQSYFQDIQVDMSSPIVTETSIKAQFQIAMQNATGNTSSDGTSKFYTVGQELYTIYSNNSYTCNVTMMGCAYIQPLMYFQLNNINMFSGTYIIQKVSHHIQPGDMTTKFVGVRMSRNSTKLVKDYMISTQSNEGNTPMTREEYETTIASVDNDCQYKHFNVDSSDGTSDYKFPMEDLDMTCVDYIAKKGKPNQWAKPNRNPQEGEKVVEYLARIVRNETTYDDTITDNNRPELVLQAKYVIATIASSWSVNLGQDLTKLIVDGFRGDNASIIANESCTKTISMIKDIFANPTQLIGETATVLSPVPYYDGDDNLENSKGMTSTKVLTNEDLNGNCFWAGKQCYATDSNAKVHRNGHYSYHHDTVKSLGHVYVRGSDKRAWNVVEQPPTDEETKDINTVRKLKRLYECIQKTCENTKSLEYIELNEVNIRNYDTLEVSSANSKEDNAKLFDMIVNCYYDDVSEIFWYKADGDVQGNPDAIMVTIRTDKKRIAIYDKNGTINSITSDSTVNETFLKSIVKRYTKDKIISERNPMPELPNFQNITNEKHKWGEAMKTLLEKLEIIPCSSYEMTHGSNGTNAGVSSGNWHTEDNGKPWGFYRTESSKQFAYNNGLKNKITCFDPKTVAAIIYKWHKQLCSGKYDVYYKGCGHCSGFVKAAIAYSSSMDTNDPRWLEGTDADNNAHGRCPCQSGTNKTSSSYGPFDSPGKNISIPGGEFGWFLEGLGFTKVFEAYIVKTKSSISDIIEESKKQGSEYTPQIGDICVEDGWADNKGHASILCKDYNARGSKFDWAWVTDMASDKALVHKADSEHSENRPIQIWRWFGKVKERSPLPS